ncbi:hypothetical protein GCM10010517_55240 [Streptosporangium fragile]|uniref:Uncharacterized protein n=1 Tax=Streptosporangium fragile TaxID=46186 RepID=A0ABP6ILV0_9ACTN
MKATIKILSILCLVQAAGGVVSNVWGDGRGWYLVNHIGFLDGYEIFASIVVGVLGLALGAAASSAGGPADPGPPR